MRESMSLRSSLALLFPAPARISPVASNGTKSDIVPVKLNLSFSPDSVEYRIYRRIDDGPLTLIAQADTVLDAGAAQDVIRSDDSMPAVSCDISYFGQALDKNLNPSPMVLLDRIHIGVSSHTPLPTPLTTPPSLIVDGAGNASIQVEWFCQGAGVDRFQAAVMSENADPPNPNGITINQSQVLFDAASGEKKTFFIKKAMISPRVGDNAFGKGPQFQMTIPVASGETYYVAVKSLGEERFDDEGFSIQSEGEFSQALTMKVPKSPTNTTHITVPWPFRTLPPVTDGGTIVKAAVLSELHADNLIQTTPSSPAATGVSIASLHLSLNPSNGFHSPFFAGNPNAKIAEVVDLKQTSTSLKALPAVLYRQQIRYLSDAVTERPASEQGALVQCSPLITEIAYSVIPSDSGSPFSGLSQMTDPAVSIADFSAQPDATIYLLDKLPVIGGATYRYWLVHFDSKNEPDRIITAGQVTIPRAAP